MSRTKRLLAVLLALCGALLCGCGQRETETEELPVLVIGSDDYEPYFYLDENGAYAGIDVEIATAACERLGWTASFQKINWQENDALLERSDVDCLWGSFSMNGREDCYRWAGPYMYSRQVVIVQADSDIRTLADLNDKRISVQISTKPEELFLKHQVPGVELWTACTASPTRWTCSPRWTKATWTPAPDTRRRTSPSSPGAPGNTGCWSRGCCGQVWARRSIRTTAAAERRL